MYHIRSTIFMVQAIEASKGDAFGQGVGMNKTKYDINIHPILAREFAKLGLIDREIAERLSICEATLNNWKREHPEFMEALKEGKLEPDLKVEQSLFSRATGHRWKEQQGIKIKLPGGGEDVKVVEIEKSVPPDPVSMIFWLKNRRPERWRDKVDIGATIATTRVDTSKLSEVQKDAIAAVAVSMLTNTAEESEETES